MLKELTVDWQCWVCSQQLLITASLVGLFLEFINKTMNLFQRILRGDFDNFLEEDIFFHYEDYSSLNEDTEWRSC